ncbi:beta-ketoacyl-ACP synthase II [Flexithrix dorotheae]|uniref:beta-ketoacyl-ACP synthase II n=1 Tax=Flexithrix dorotheae TaxID=70993 RepID=UPI000362666C|nr:beta-ketoacyl-ACP synthase II [Flexithrix dorotheae]
MKNRRVVITGMGAITPIGNNLNQYWKALEEGKSGAAPITRFDHKQFKTHFACEVKDFDPLDYFDRKEARKMDLYTQFAMVSSEEALNDAALPLDQINKKRVGVIWATGIGGFQTFEEEVEGFVKNEGNPRFNPFFIHKIIPDTAAGLISIKHGFQGINFCTVSACASSSNAIIDAFNYIKWGKADVFVTGGSEAPITQASVGGFNAMKALSTNNEDFTRASRPFDENRDGFVIGEGGAALILEEYEHAKNRGAKIYAEIIGGGMAADAYHITATHPEGIGAFDSMSLAIEDAGISPQEIDYINAHATSTGLGDVSELKAISKLFGHVEKQPLISATKSMTGHLLGGAGSIEAVASVMAIHKNIIPPTINTTQIDPELPEDVSLVIGDKVAAPVNVALSNTFGFGGHNASIIFRRVKSH